LQTLFEKYGRTPAVAAIVRAFYKRVLAQDQLSGYFAAVPFERLIEHQIAFVSVAMGEEASAYTGRDMAEAHRNLQVTGEHFDLVMSLLETTLQEAQIEPADVALIMGKVGALKSTIVSA
jgi:hemoglobin